MTFGVSLLLCIDGAEGQYGESPVPGLDAPKSRENDASKASSQGSDLYIDRF